MPQPRVNIAGQPNMQASKTVLFACLAATMLPDQEPRALTKRLTTTQGSSGLVARPGFLLSQVPVIILRLRITAVVIVAQSLNG